MHPVWRLVLAALLASAGALAPGTGAARRAVLGQAAAASGAGAVLLAPLLVPLAARAQELKQASDAEVYRRAAEGKLTPERVIERAAEGTLVMGEGASRAELEEIIAVDRQALKLAKAKQAGLSGKGHDEEKKEIAGLEARLEAQLARLTNVWWGRPLFKSGVGDEARR